MNGSGECWFAPPWTMLPIAARRCLVRNPHNGAALELSSGEYAVLSACEGCRSLADHEARAAAQLSAPPEHRPAFREVIERCASLRLLMPLSELVSRFGSHRDAPRAPFGGIGIRTSDRPRLLARLLASAVRLEARGAPKRRWVVFDDSRDPENESANRGAVEACDGLDIEHLGRIECAALERDLSVEFPGSQREIAWLLGAGSVEEATYGRPLNHALLRFAGTVFVLIDDDVVLDPRRPASIEPGFSVSADADELFWYEDQEALARACPPVEIDPIAMHASWLGLPLATAWSRAEREAGALATIDLRPPHVRRFAPDAEILFTHNHAYGDPGSSLLPLQLLTLPRRSLQRLASEPNLATSAFSQRIDWRGQTRLRLAPERVLTFTTMAGIDNSILMPPAARSERSEDVLLGILAQWMHPSAWLADLPFALPHQRDSTKRWIPATANFMQELLHVLYGWIDERATAITAEVPEQRLRAIGSLLLDLAASSDARLLELLREHAAEAGSRTLFAISEQLEDAELPAKWKELIAPWLKSPAFAVDRTSVEGRALAPGKVRAFAGAYGKVILAWPQLWQFCRERSR
jgi:hypothetical protein